jgi:sugar lactone lactonase YvrE
LDGQLTEARFVSPSGLARDGAGNLYVTDSANQRLAKITPAGKVTTIRHMQLTEKGVSDWFPGIAVDQSGHIYAMHDGLLRKFSPTGEVLRTYNLGAKSLFPRGLAVDKEGTLYVTDGWTVRKIPANGEMTILAGSEEPAGITGVGAPVRFNLATGIAVASDGTVYVTEPNLHIVRKITPAGVVTTLAGTSGQRGAVDGEGELARFDTPWAVTVDASDVIHVVEAGNAIRRITATGRVSSWGNAELARVLDPDPHCIRYFQPSSAIVVDDVGVAYVPMGTLTNLTYYGCPVLGGGSILRIAPTGASTHFAGLPRAVPPSVVDGPAGTARFYGPDTLASHSDGSVYAIDSRRFSKSETSFAQVQVALRKIDASGAVMTLTGVLADMGIQANPLEPTFYEVPIIGTGPLPFFTTLSDVVVDATGNTYTLTRTVEAFAMLYDNKASYQFGQGGKIYKSSAGAGGRPSLLWSSTSTPLGMALTKAGDLVVLTEGASSFTVISAKTGGVLGTLGTAQDTAEVNSLYRFAGMLVDVRGSVLVANTNSIRRIPGNALTAGGLVTASPPLVIGSDYVAGYVDGPASVARFNDIRALAQDAAGNIYVADSGNHAVRKIDPSGTVSTLIGGPAWQGIRVDAAPASLDSPRGLTVDRDGWLYISSAGAVLKYKLSP